MIPAHFTTDDPPFKIDSVELQEYVNGLRRRIEVQNYLLENLAKELQEERGRGMVEAYIQG
jgi:hypothetical protein